MSSSKLHRANNTLHLCKNSPTLNNQLYPDSWLRAADSRMVRCDVFMRPLTGVWVLTADSLMLTVYCYTATDSWVLTVTRIWRWAVGGAGRGCCRRDIWSQNTMGRCGLFLLLLLRCHPAAGDVFVFIQFRQHCALSWPLLLCWIKSWTFYAPSRSCQVVACTQNVSAIHLSSMFLCSSDSSSNIRRTAKWTY